jgi:hypothetical protein
MDQGGAMMAGAATALEHGIAEGDQVVRYCLRHLPLLSPTPRSAASARRLRRLVCCTWLSCGPPRSSHPEL